MTDWNASTGYVPARSSRSFTTSTPAPAPAPAPAPSEPSEPGLSVGERALSVVKNIVVIVTCLVVLYTIWRGYVALQAAGDALQELQSSFGQ